MVKNEKTTKKVGTTVKASAAKPKKMATSADPITTSKKTGGTVTKTSGSTPVKPQAKGKTPAKTSPVKARTKKSASQSPKRYKCRLCGYIYSPLRGEPQHGIPAGTEFDDLPEDYVCPLCGFQGKGKIGKWGFEEWHPTKYICSVCGYVYDEARGEPHRGIKAGTTYEDLPDDYVCPVCALDPKIDVQFGKVRKQGFGPLYIP